MMNIKRFETGPVFTNMYLAYDNTNHGFIVDCAYPSDKLKKFVEENNITIDFILQTHTHFDHVLGLDYFRKLYNVDVYASFDSKEIANDPDYNLGYNYDINITIDKYLDDYEKFSDRDILAIKTPGHTLDSMSYKFENIIFSGDTLFKSSIGRTDFPGGDYETIIDSIINKLAKYDRETVIYPGHGESTTIGYELDHNPFLK